VSTTSTNPEDEELPGDEQEPDEAAHEAEGQEPDDEPVESLVAEQADADQVAESEPSPPELEEGVVEPAAIKLTDENEPEEASEPESPLPEEMTERESPAEPPGIEPPAASPVEVPKQEGDSIFDSSADLEDILSAMEDVKQDEAESIAKAVKAIELGETSASEMLEGMSTDLQDKIQKTLDQRSLEQKEEFVTEEDFVKMASTKTDRTWYHCLFYLAFNSEDGSAGKKILYDALKNDLSKNPVDPLPEHMFNFGLSSLVKVQLYDKPLVGFKKGTFTLQFDRKKLQELLLQIGRPLSKRPIITKKEEKKMIEDFFSF
jgi:hypothetical protein